MSVNALSSSWNAYWSLYICIRLSKPHQHDVYLIVSRIKVTFPHKKDVLKQSYTADSAIAIHMHWCHSLTSAGIIFPGYKNTQRNRENNRGFEIKWTINRRKSVFLISWVVYVDRKWLSILYNPIYNRLCNEHFMQKCSFSFRIVI